MGILDGIVEWIAEQVMYGLDLINTSVLGALGCDMTTFLRYFPAAETMYNIFVALAIGMILLNLIWQLFKNYGLIAGVEAEDPVKLTIRSVLAANRRSFSNRCISGSPQKKSVSSHNSITSLCPSMGSSVRRAVEILLKYVLL